MKKLKNWNKLGGGKIVDKEKKILTAELEFVVRLIYQRGGEMLDGKWHMDEEVGEKPPECFSDFPEEEGDYLCPCGKHIISTFAEERNWDRIVVELPEELIT